MEPVFVCICVNYNDIIAYKKCIHTPLHTTNKNTREILYAIIAFYQLKTLSRWNFATKSHLRPP